MQDQQAQYADEYALHLLLGEGGQASVYLGSKNNELYALKVYQPGAAKEAAYKVQADFLKKLNFPHLINMVDCRLDAKIKLTNKAEERRPLIVLELAEGGELFEYISKLGRFTPEVCRTYLKQLISAIKYLSDIGVSHRDLKPENILFNSDFLLKVSDFGLSRDAKGDHGDYKLRTRVGTEGYKPPEMEAGNYTGFQADIFAAGVVLFIMHTGSPPFLSTKPHDRIYKMIKEKNFTKFWQLHEKSKPLNFFSPEFKRLLNSFFSFEADRRPTFETLGSDDWMNGDELMKDELREYMLAKAQKLAESDPAKKEIAKIKQQLFKDKLMEEECCVSEEGVRAESDSEGEEELQEEQLFARTVRRLNIKVDDLPTYSRKKVVYAAQEPAYIVAWLKNFLAEQFKNKEVFMKDFVGEIAPVKYELKYLKETAQVELSFEFSIDEEEETELKLLGQLHRSEKGEVGVEWTKVEGHSYWLAAIESQLNESLQTLA